MRRLFQIILVCANNTNATDLSILEYFTYLYLGDTPQQLVGVMLMRKLRLPELDQLFRINAFVLLPQRSSAGTLVLQ